MGFLPAPAGSIPRDLLPGAYQLESDNSWLPGSVQDGLSHDAVPDKRLREWFRGRHGSSDENNQEDTRGALQATLRE